MGRGDAYFWVDWGLVVALVHQSTSYDVPRKSYGQEHELDLVW